MDKLFFETKFSTEATGEISGIAWPFGTPDRVGDIIELGAFKKAKMPIPMLFGHDMNDPVGAWESASEKPDGLHLSGKMLVSDVARAKEVAALVKGGAVRGISIGFVTKKSFTRKDGGRTITDLDLIEASLVTIPMHPGARVTSAKDAFTAFRMASALQRAAAQIRKGA